MSENGSTPIGKSAQPRELIPAPQYTLTEAIGVCLALAQRALEEVRDLAETGAPKAQMRRLEDRVRAVEQRALLEHAGTWNKSSEYYPGQVVVCNGSSWVAKTHHAHGEPGKCDDWQLMVQRGARADSKELMDKLRALEHRLAVLEQRGGR